MPGMGFRHVEDPRDKRFLMGPLLAEHAKDIAKYFPQGLPPGTRHYRTGPVLDQGETGTCTAFCGTHRVHASPIMQPLPINPKTAARMTPYDLYRIIIGLDEFDDNDFEISLPDTELQSGSSVRAVAKALQQLGIIKTYLHAGSIEDIRAWHLAGFGGIMFGTTWYAGMMTTDSEGFVKPTGAVEGGHAYASCGWNDSATHNGRTVRACHFQNNWGTGFGLKGFFWIEEQDIGTLFPDGEFIAPLEIKFSAQAESPKTAWDYLRPWRTERTNPEPF